MKKLSLIISCFLMLVSCASNDEDKADVVINIDDYAVEQAATPAEFMNSEPRYICLSNDTDLSFTFTYIGKVVIKNNLMYILESEMGSTRLLIFDGDGNPVNKISCRGNGPGEYLQITDFDVTEDGDIWITDEQKKAIFKYSSNCEFEKSIPFKNEIDKICCLSDGLFLCMIASWDTSDYAGSQLIVTDTSFVVKSVLSKFPKIKDDNFVFISNFSPTSHSVFYCDPIEDRLYEVGYDGSLARTYDFNFGAQKVPEKYKANVDLHFDQIKSKYKFIFRSYRISTNFITVGIEAKKWGSAVINKSDKTIAYFDDEISGFSLVGQCPEGSIWQLSESDNTDSLPENVQEWIRNDRDVLVIIPDE